MLVAVELMLIVSRVSVLWKTLGDHAGRYIGAWRYAEPQASSYQHRHE